MSESLYKRIKRSLRLKMINLLFTLLRVNDLETDPVNYEDLDIIFGANKFTLEEKKDVTFRRSVALAGVGMIPGYVSLLYSMIKDIERKHLTTSNQFKKEIQVGTVLFLLKHIEEIGKARTRIESSQYASRDKLLHFLKDYHKKNLHN